MEKTFVYISTLLLGFHYFFFYFTNSNFLSQYTDEGGIALLYALGGVVNLILFFYLQKILRKFGNYTLILGLLIVEAICLIGLGSSTSLLVIAPLFILTQAINPLIVFSLDIFLEKYSRNKSTGNTRGIFLLATNIPPIVCPLIVGLILTTAVYWKLYFIAAVFLIPLFYIIAVYFKDFDDPLYLKLDIAKTANEIHHNKDIFGIMIVNTLLNFFYAWMVIYMPIHLIQHINFSWEETGVIFSFMLLPFILFQLPLGRLADTRFGEKEILVLGFAIMGVTTMLIPQLQEANLVLWAILLFCTRIGASFVEVGAETYFFKKITVRDSNLIGVFRMIRDIPYIAAPPLAVVIIYFGGFSGLFLVLGLVMLYGIRVAYKLKDTL